MEDGGEGAQRWDWERKRPSRREGERKGRALGGWRRWEEEDGRVGQEVEEQEGKGGRREVGEEQMKEEGRREVGVEERGERKDGVEGWGNEVG